MFWEIVLGLVGILIISILATVGWVIGTYNTGKTGQQDIGNQWSNIKTEYQRRADLFLNLVETVKSYKKFEKSTLVEVIQARSGNFGKNQKEEIKNMKGLDKTFNRLMLLTESYPTLKANEQHNQLMEEIRITEDRINICRTDYNAIVRDYNVFVTTFPNTILTTYFGFTKQEFFINEDYTNSAPKIQLD